MIAKILEALATFQTRDWITLVASLGALILPVLTLCQKSGESRLALRKQLTDLLEKLTELNTEVAKFRTKRDDYPANYIPLLNDQRRFLVRQAAFGSGVSACWPLLG